MLLGHLDADCHSAINKAGSAGGGQDMLIALEILRCLTRSRLRLPTGNVGQNFNTIVSTTSAASALAP